MTQHRITIEANNEISYSILTGWDRPMQGFFLVVCDKEEEMVYTNLSEMTPHPVNFDFFREVLSGLGIRLPEKMLTTIKEDRIENRGNVFIDWNEELKT